MGHEQPLRGNARMGEGRFETRPSGRPCSAHRRAGEPLRRATAAPDWDGRPHPRREERTPALAALPSVIGGPLYFIPVAHTCPCGLSQFRPAPRETRQPPHRVGAKNETCKKVLNCRKPPTPLRRISRQFSVSDLAMDRHAIQSKLYFLSGRGYPHFCG
jgi:hypothetical protein